MRARHSDRRKVPQITDSASIWRFPQLARADSVACRIADRSRRPPKHDVMRHPTTEPSLRRSRADVPLAGHQFASCRSTKEAGPTPSTVPFIGHHLGQLNTVFPDPVWLITFQM